MTARFLFARGHRSARPDAGTEGGLAGGTVLAWDPLGGQGIVRVADAALEGPVAVTVAALHRATGGTLRVGQAVDVEWECRDHEAHAVLVRPRADPPAIPGG